jgi:hypothetical protein
VEKSKLNYILKMKFEEKMDKIVQIALYMFYGLGLGMFLTFFGVSLCALIKELFFR